MNYGVIQNLVYRGFKYSLASGSTFLLDLAIVFTLILLFNVHYIAAVVVGFVIGLSVNYFISYHLVFTGTTQVHRFGYPYFLTIGIITIIVVLAIVYLLVNFFNVDVFVARILAALIGGTINFLANTFFNFKVI